MKKRNNNKLFLAGIFIVLVFSIGAGISFLKNESPAETLGARIGLAGTLPSKVNINDLDDASINNYYAGVDGLSGNNLKNALYNIIKNHREYDYNSSNDRFAYKIMDRNWTLSPASEVNLNSYNYSNDNPYIRKLYADYNDDIATADRFKNAGASRVSFDKEHIWAQSLGNFGRDFGAGSDFHHLLPSDVKGNQNFHSNYNFSEPKSGITNYYNDQGGYVGRNGYISGYSQKVAEPLDEYKGDIARAMLYMPVRYNVYVNDDHPKLELVNGSPSATTASPTQSGLAGDLATLLRWHVEDPVDYYEIHRNNLIYNNFQLNRNPFIDHPEWAEMVYDPTYSGAGASTGSGTSTAVGEPGVLVQNIVFNKSFHSMGKNSEYTLSASVLPTNAYNKTLTWSSSNTNIATISNGRVNSLNNYGTTTITATATDGSNVSASCVITVEPQIDKEVDRLEVVDFQERVSFGKTYPRNSLTIYLYFEDGTYNDVTYDAEVSLPNTNLLGEQVLSVQYSTHSTTYEVFVTNDDALLTYSEIGSWYESDQASGGAINGWTNGIVGTAYSDGSVKLEGSTNSLSGHNIYKSDIWSETSSENIIKVEVQVELKLNGSVGEKNELRVHLLNGSNSVAYDAQFELSGSSVFTIELSTKSTITGVKVEYYYKQSGNYGVYSVKARPTYEHEDYLPQAEAWATYFLNKTSDQCEALEPQREEDWIILGSEFNLMHSTSKAFYTDSTSSELVLAAIDRYNAIIRAHPENEPFIAGLENVQIYVLPKILNNNVIIILTIILLLSSTIISLYVLETYRKTKKYEIK
ncbi:MAG: hypothetical protein GX132_02995 [Erysipelotrichia bacterium]|nr:hypothetical protein [Erysipelotrichia bacterium]